MNIIQNTEAPKWVKEMVGNNEKALNKALDSFANHKDNIGLVSCKLQVKISTTGTVEVKQIAELTDLEKIENTFQGTYQRNDESFFVENVSPEPKAKAPAKGKGK